MENDKRIEIRGYREADFLQINELNRIEGWSNLVEKSEDTRKAFAASLIKLVACEGEKVVGYIRCLGDGYVTTYICELLIDKDYRGCGIGETMIKKVYEMYPKTRMELLASSTSHTFYEKLKFRGFYGFRKTKDE